MPIYAFLGGFSVFDPLDGIQYQCNTQKENLSVIMIVVVH